MTSPPLDLTALPRGARGARAFAVWGVALLVAIELTVVASMITSYFYLRVTTSGPWPPPGIAPPDPTLATLALASLLASLVPLHLTLRALRQGTPARLRPTLATGLALAAGYVVLSALDLAKKPHDWTVNAYTSIEWTLSGYQLFHVIALTGLLAALTVAALRGRFDRLDPTDLAIVDGALLYWAFVAAAAVPAWATLYLSPRLLGADGGG